MTKELIWHGPIWGQSGYEVLTRGMIIALDKIGIKVKIDHAESWNRESLDLPWEIRHRLERMVGNKVGAMAPVIMHQKEQPIVKSINPDAKRYCYTLFETDHLPEPWIKGLKRMNSIFTFSDFNKRCWVNNDNIPEDKIHVLPWGVDENFKPNGPRAQILNAKGYNFLANGDFTERKNFEALIEAYVTEFKPNEDVALILKAHQGGFTQAHKDALRSKIMSLVKMFTDNPPKILFFPDKISTEDMAALYRACQCLVMPTRGEGLGLPVVEAMACGLPVIATNGSALDELNFHGYLLIPKEETINSIEYIKKCPHALNHKWLSIDVDELKVCMRSAYINKEFMKQAGEINSSIACGRTWHEAAIKIAEVLYGTN
jgi:glycosyltransferase involved in cell wall biosynthesis